MASSANNIYRHHQSPYEYNTTSAPPPTPLSKPISPDAAAAAATDVLSTLFHRLPPSLSLRPRRPASNSPPPVSPPIISLAQKNPNLHSDLLLASRQTGFFQLTGHSVPPKLAHSAESESLSLFDLPRDQKILLGFPSNSWPPLGFDFDDDEEEEENHDPNTLCLDSSCSTQSATTDLSLSSIREFICEMERLGLEVIQLLSESLGLVNPVRNDPTRFCSLLWVSDLKPSCKESSRMYPYVVGLQYQIRCQKYSLQSGSGLVSVSPHIDSVLVSLGDIAKVWSNGQIKNVRGRPTSIIEDPKRRYITMSLLLSLPLDNTVSPLLSVGEKELVKEEEDEDGDDAAMKFRSFCFEDYAWRVYHERMPIKDPLDRYLI